MPNINKNIIMQAGAAVANATNKAAGLSASTPEPGTIISAIQLVNGGRKIGPADVVHFTESVRNKLLSLLVSMEPIQDFNGYGHPWPAGGGKNKLPPTVAETKSENGLSCTSDGNGNFTFSGTLNGTFNKTFTDIGTAYVIQSGDYLHCLNSAASTSVLMNLYFTDNTNTYVILSPENKIQSLSGHEGKTIKAIRFYAATQYNGTVSPMIVNSNTPTEFEPWENICPISGRTGANAYISPTPNVADATTYAADWTTPAGTVYAGSADIVTGDIKAAPYYASYNGETLVGPWVSSMDEYDPEGTPTTGAQVVDLGGTMTEYHITGQDIITLVGDNYIWSDSGDVTITE
jgi:hypothetical protein